MPDSQYSAYQGPFPSTMPIRADIQTFGFSQYAVFVQRSFVVCVDKYIALYSDRIHSSYSHTENTRNISIKFISGNVMIELIKKNIISAGEICLTHFRIIQYSHKIIH